MSQKKESDKKTSTGISYLFSLVDHNKKSLNIAIFFSVLSGLCTFVPYMMVFKTILFVFNQTGDIHTAMTYGIIATASIILRFIFLAISLALTHIGAYNTLYLVRHRVSEHIGEINLGFFTDNSSGEIKKILVEDVERIEVFLAHQIPDIVVAIVVPITVFIYLLTVSLPMALILLIPITLTVILQVIMGIIARPLMPEMSSLLGKLNSVIIQLVNGMPVMKTFNLTADSYQNYATTIDDFNVFWKNVASKFAPIRATCNVILESGIFFTLPLGGYLYLTNSLDLASYVFFVIMSIVFLSSYSNLINFVQIFSQIASGIDRIKKVMDIPVIKSGNHTLCKTGKYDVNLNHVRFSYGKKEVLRDISCCLKKGSLTAFVGASGAGKTTAAQLIPRYWDLDSGTITIDGHPINNIQSENLMNLVSFVFQETFILGDTVYQNISIGKANASKEDVEAAAKAAQIHDFIMHLPNQYDTDLSANGIKMSGGEKQRICIARAILKNAPIIIFDEATSFTDIENEHKIQLALNHLLVGKTTIMIAHRLHTIVHADQICIFEAGEIKEIGTHHTLLEKNGLYSNMWQTYTRQKEVRAL
ncbi:MAG: ABC transporter ATP-binding protein [Eubacteriales bacterium]